ncbi:hypothetical protein [Gilvimarinus chinensis]|uniref:hypothetical protein n=1 Tax=Gilvimarinus chinensis TaxID=396005 RepID=UPI00036F7FDB|nr:hypothetical protein [Gilvimarinus chinensis]
MKFSSLFLLLSVSLCQYSSAEESTDLSGTWELVNGYLLQADGEKVAYDLEAMVSRKVLTATDYAFVSRKGGEFWAASTGPYKVNGDQYTETPELLSYSVKDGTSYTFSFTLEGDDWHTKRVENGKAVEEEHWRRVR